MGILLLQLSMATMNDFNDTVSTGFEDDLEAAHSNLAEADEDLVYEMIMQLSNRTSEVLSLDDLDVYTIDRAGDSPHNHINDKEIVSGDATAWFRINNDGYEEVVQVDIEYGVYAGTQKNVDGFIYDPVEVVVEIKD